MFGILGAWPPKSALDRQTDRPTGEHTTSLAEVRTTFNRQTDRPTGEHITSLAEVRTTFNSQTDRPTGEHITSLAEIRTTFNRQTDRPTGEHITSLAEVRTTFNRSRRPPDKQLTSRFSYRGLMINITRGSKPISNTAFHHIYSARSCQMSSRSRQSTVRE